MKYILLFKQKMALVFHYSKDLPTPTPLKAEYLKNQVITIKNIFQPEQKSKEWYEMRSNMLTASDWGTVLGENHYSNSNEVLKKKCGDDKFVTNAAMDWGNKYEDVAVSVYKHRNKIDIWDFGCLRHPSISFLGASPDGITPDGVMLEIKCPTSRQITGIPPSYYWCQVQGQLEVCELDRCDFLECRFKEYSSEVEYLMDNYENDFKLNKYGHEKGINAEFYVKAKDIPVQEPMGFGQIQCNKPIEVKKFIYEYAPVCLTGNDLEHWKENIVKKYNSDNIIFSCFSYWYLEEVSCVPIYRNQEWFNNAKVELEIFWNKVLKYRNLGYEKLLEDIQTEKDEKKNLKLQKKEEKEELEGKKPRKSRAVSSSSSKGQKKMNEFIVLDKMITDSSSDEDSNNHINGSIFNNVSMFS